MQSSGRKNNHKDKVLGQEIPGTSGTQTSRYPGQKNLCRWPFLLFSTWSGWDVPGFGSGRLGFGQAFCKKTFWGWFLFPKNTECKNFLPRAQRLKTSISIEFFNLAWNFQSWPSEFPTTKTGESNRPLTPILLKSIAIHLPFLSRYFCKSMPSVWQKVAYTPICIAIRLPFVSQYFFRSIRVRGHWNTPTKKTRGWWAARLKFSISLENFNPGGRRSCIFSIFGPLGLLPGFLNNANDHPAAKGGRQKGIDKKVTKSVKKCDKMATKTWPKRTKK